MGTALFLVAIAAGYWMLDRALAHQGTMKTIGLYLGVAVLLGGMVGILADAAYSVIAYQKGYMTMGYSQQKGACPCFGKMQGMPSEGSRAQ